MKQYLSLLIFWICFTAFGQDNPFTGTVADAITKEPLPFTNIKIIHPLQGTVSNSEGHFILSSKNVDPKALIVFSYMGYTNYTITAEELQKRSVVYLEPYITKLKEVEVSSRPLTAEEIIKLVLDNYDKNHPKLNQLSRLYYHNYVKTPFSKTNKLTVKESDFVGLDMALFNDLFNQLPNTFIEYQDAILDLYSLNEDHKLLAVEAISLEEGSMEKIAKEMEENLSTFFTDIEQTAQNEDTYYQFKTGILGFKFGKEGIDTSWNTYREDTINYHIASNYIKTEIGSLLKNYASPEGDNWEFLTSPKKYQYTKEEMTIFNDELVYVISFIPEKTGLFQGNIYISALTYGLLQIDFDYAEGKQSEKFQLLGVGHAINYKKGHVIYEKLDSIYVIKYIQTQQKEMVSINRKFTVKKKQKRFFMDKKLNQIKLHADLYFNSTTTKEILFLNRRPLEENIFENVREPATIKFKKEYAHFPEIWNNRTVIAPNKELKNYKQIINKP